MKVKFFFFAIFTAACVYIGLYYVLFVIALWRGNFKTTLVIQIISAFFLNYQITSLGPRTCMNFYNSKHNLCTYTKNATKARLMMAH